MAEKNKIIQSNGDKMVLWSRIGPIEKLIAVKVVIANNKMAFTA
jgi:hypothetical protein